MSYHIKVRPSAEKEIRQLDSTIQGRIIKAINALIDEPRGQHVKKLRNKNAYRRRVGDYRILFEINDAESKVIIGAVRHRKDVYRN